MGDEFVAPVKVLLKALDAGIKLSNRLLESVGSVDTTKALQISQSAPNIQRSLERTSQAIRDVYQQGLEACGHSFRQALLDDKSITKRLKDLKNDIRDRIDECQDFEDDPESFDPATFANIQKESQRCFAECISIFNGLQAQIIESHTTLERPRDDRTSLRSMQAQGPPTPNPASGAVLVLSESTPVAAPVMLVQGGNSGISPTPMEPTRPRNPWSINGSSRLDMGPLSQTRQLSRDISPSSIPPELPAEEQTRYIAKEVVRHRISENDDFLERRRQSKVLFHNELQRQSTPKSTSIISIERPSSSGTRISASIDENRVSEIFERTPQIPSPQLGNSVIASSSPIDGRNSRNSSSSYDQMVLRQRGLGQSSQDARNSRSSSFVHEGAAQRQDLHRQDSSGSQDSIFGLRAATSPIMPMSPTLGVHNPTGRVNVENLATTLKTPNFGQNIEDGIEVMNGNYDFSSEKMVVESVIPIQNQITGPTPTASMKSTDCPMRHDTSFYQYRGFCEGAATLIRGRPGEDWYKIVKRPSGHYSATVSAKCHKCSYEVGWNDFQKDKILDVSGIYMSWGIRWRQRFLTKSHLRSPAIDAGTYACVFCVEEHKTIEEHDATVFFSVQQLFRHLSRHTQPLPLVAGISVIYGNQPPTVLDFDLDFTSPIPKISEFPMSEIYQKVVTRPSAHAAVTHHPKPNSNASRDPAGDAVLHFAAGARIVGITFPDRFKGEWYSGYHDGDRGSFPASTIILEQPNLEGYMMNAKSTLVATARWDFKPKDAKDGHWLKFNRGDRISCIGYMFQDQWCWSGHNNKGKWGIFPRAFVENLVDGGPGSGPGTSPGSVRSSTFVSRMGGFSLGRKASKQERIERGMSIRSTSSGGSVGAVMEGQPGLEVAASPTQGIRSFGSWGKI